MNAPLPPPSVKQPAYLGVALTVAWFLGLTSVQEGYLALRLVRDPLSVDSLGLPSSVAEALLSGVVDHQRVALPVSLAELILGGLLVVVSAGLLFGARIPVPFALQVLYANLAFAVFAYYMNEPVRRALIGALVALQPAEGSESLRPEAYIWGFRVGLGLHLVALGLAGVALTRPRVREFLARSAPPPRES